MLPSGERIQRITSKQAKKAYSKRGGQLSDKQKRQIAREAELDRRADAIRQKELRKKELARQRAEKEAQQRESRKGTVGPIDDAYVSPRQTRMEGFFRNPTSRCGSAVVESPIKPEEATCDEDSAQLNNLEGRDHRDDGPDNASQDAAVVNLVSPQDDAEEEVDLPTVISMTLQNGLETASATQEQAAGHRPVMVPERPPVTAFDGRRKRKALSRASSGISCYTQPVRMPLRVVDPNVHIDKQEIWIPPSQNTVHSKKRLNCTFVPNGLLPKPELARLAPSSPSPASLAPMDSVVNRGNKREEKSPHRPLACEEAMSLKAAELPQMPSKPVDIDSEFMQLAELLSSDPVFETDKMPPPPVPLTPLDTQAPSPTELVVHDGSRTAAHRRITVQKQTAAKDKPGTEARSESLDSILADLTSSQFSSVRLSQTSFQHPVTETEMEPPNAEQLDSDDDVGSEASYETVMLSDPFDLSLEEAEALEVAATAAVGVHRTSKPGVETAAAVAAAASAGIEERVDGDATPQGLLPRSEPYLTAERHGVEQDAARTDPDIGESFGFGDFDFTSQDVRALDGM